MFTLTKEKLFKLDQEWWGNEVPCLHRVHNSCSISGAHKIQNKIGMSISFDKLEAKLQVISNKVKESNIETKLNKKALCTFDDGHKDILLTVDVLAKYPMIQPVVFLTGKQLVGDTTPLPLTALYSWCHLNELNPNKLISDFGFSRESLKAMPENEQRNLLIKNGVDINPVEEEMLSLREVSLLVSKGWLIAYHGSSHCDLRIYSSIELRAHFQKDFERLTHLKFKPWIAWPEGRWNDSLAEMAFNVGFQIQFGLIGEKGVGTKSYCINRTIWN